MSKSKGTGVDPLAYIERYGADATRFAVVWQSSGQDIHWDEAAVTAGKKFANKIWNAARFILMHLEGPRRTAPLRSRPLADRWLFSRLNRTIRDVNVSLEHYRFDHAARHLYQFIWHEYCDWYLELVKPLFQPGAAEDAALARQSLLESFEIVLRLLHPMMPFVTEEIWQAFPHEGESITTQPYPQPAEDLTDKEAEARFHMLARFVDVARTGRALLQYPPGRTSAFYGASSDEQEHRSLDSLRAQAAFLCRGSVAIRPPADWPAQNLLRLTDGGLTVGLQVSDDVELQKVVDRIKKQLEEGRRESQRMDAKLESPDFVSKAPSEVVAELRQRLAALRHEQDILTTSEAQLRAMMLSRLK
jgi:valyl-tRNA synthetase